LGKLFGRKPDTLPVNGNGLAPAPPGPSKSLAPSTRSNIAQSGKPKQTITSEELRDFRELMRQRYSLDIQIWSDREAASWDHELVQDKMDKADATMRTILSKIEAWDNLEYFAKPEDFEKMQTIKQRITKNRPWIWAENPPWEDKPKLSF
jgi:hypothetical protein